MHRAFRPTTKATSATTFGPAFAQFCARLRSLGLVEEQQAETFLYRYKRPSGETRHFATLQGGRRHLTLYLYPDALGAASGSATAFYRILDDAGLGMGSKLGPSIGIDLEDEEQLRLVHSGLEALIGACRPTHSSTIVSDCLTRPSVR